MNLTTLINSPLATVFVLLVIVILFFVAFSFVSKKLDKKYIDVAYSVVKFVQQAVSALNISPQVINLLDTLVKAIGMAITAVGAGTPDAKADSALGFFKDLLQTYEPGLSVTDAQYNLIRQIFYFTFIMLVSLEVNTATLDTGKLQSKLTKQCKLLR